MSARDPRIEPMLGDVLHRASHYSCGYLMEYVPVTVLARVDLLVASQRDDSPHISWCTLDDWREQYRGTEMLVLHAAEAGRG